MLILTKKDHQDQTKNVKVMRFQNFPNFAENLTQFSGYLYTQFVKIMGAKKVSEIFLLKIFFGFFLFFENIFGGHFYSLFHSLRHYTFHLH